MSARSALERLVATYPSVLVGYSGGVDSALVAVVARRVLGKERAVAALGISPSLSTAQRCQAVKLARRFDLHLMEVATEELGDPAYVANSRNRCYFCKRELWRKLTRLAAELGIAVVADGTNADDLGEHRPGVTAAAQRGVRSPLYEAGYTKEAVRREARALSIPVWNAPAAPCLASRVLYGLAVTPDRLRQVEAGEAVLRAMGVQGDLRVRHRGAEARIEVAPPEFDRIRAQRHGIARALLNLGFERVTLDLRGYRRGSLLGVEEPPLELLGARA